MGTQKQFLGAAAPQALAAGLTNSGLSFTTSDSTGMPAGGTHPFVVVIENGTPNEEKVLVDSRTGNTYTVNAAGRGYDGTSAIAHNSGSPVLHVLDAISLNEFSAHENDTTLDEHTQYLNTTRHDTASRHVFGGALASPSTPAAIATTASVGTSSAPAHGDHVHTIGAGAINDAGMFAAGILGSAGFADGSVTTAKLAASAVTTAKIANDAQGHPFICTSSTRPGSPTQGALILETDTHRIYLYDNSKWNYIYGGTNPTAARAHLNVFGPTTIANNTATKIPFDVEDFDYGSCFATGTYTVPTAGQYQVNARVAINANNATQELGILIYQNGSAVSSGNYMTLRGMAGGEPLAVQANDIIDCTISDTIDIYVLQVGVGSTNACTLLTAGACFVSVIKF